MATKELECGCVVEWPPNNNKAAKNRAKSEHEEVCPAWKAIRDQRRASHAERERNKLEKVLTLCRRYPNGLPCSDDEDLWWFCVCGSLNGDVDFCEECGRHYIDEQ